MVDKVYEVFVRLLRCFCAARTSCKYGSGMFYQFSRGDFIGPVGFPGFTTCMGKVMVLGWSVMVHGL